MENYVNRPLSDKSMKFGKMVVHDLTNDISSLLKIARNGKIFVVSILLIHWYKILHSCRS